jgi:hypothetical protein
MALRLCCGGAFTRDCLSGLEIGALVATLLLQASDHHKKHCCEYKDNPINSNLKRYKLILVVVLEQPWHYD